MKSTPSPINSIWLFLIVSATVVAAYTGKMATVTEASFEAAEDAVTLAFGLIGSTALWLGLMRVLEEAGGLKLIVNGMRPIMIRLFPGVPPSHPAMSAMLLNLAANALGLGNAATPMGLKAMEELDQLNPEKGTATDAMCLFLAINTSSVTLIPISVITVRASAGSDHPGAILLPTLFATFFSTSIAILAAKIMARRQPLPSLSIPVDEDKNNKGSEEEYQTFKRDRPSQIGQIVFGSLIVMLIGAMIYNLSLIEIPNLGNFAFFQKLSTGLIPILISSILLFGYFQGVRVYETLTEGAVGGFKIAVKVIPFMVAIFVAIGMFRASGALDIFALFLSPLTQLIGLPTEAIPMILIRPLSGSGSFGLMSEIVTQNPNSFLADLVSTMQGSTETTFYILAVYFGSVGIRRTRYALPVALCADAAGMFASFLICRLTFY